jgi:hypothetical protein
MPVIAVIGTPSCEDDQQITHPWGNVVFLTVHGITIVARMENAKALDVGYDVCKVVSGTKRTLVPT